MHPRAFEPIFDHQFVRTLHHSTANRPALRDKHRVLQLRYPCFQIGQRAGQLYVRRLRRDERAQLRHHRRWAGVLERVAELHKLSRRQERPIDAGRLGDCGQIFGRVSEIENAYRRRVVQIHK